MKSADFIERYLGAFRVALDGTEVHSEGKALSFGAALDRLRAYLAAMKDRGHKIMLIGNGGSAGIASHLAVDFWKNGGVEALAFNDSSLLTCIANDYDFQDVFAVPVDHFGNQGDMLIAISSSGSSENILRAVAVAKEKGILTVTCSGFDPENPLRQRGDINFYVPARAYGFVETLHQLIVHSILDAMMYLDGGMDVFDKNASPVPEEKA